MGDVKVRLTTRLKRGGAFLFLALVMLAHTVSVNANVQATPTSWRLYLTM